MLALVVRTNRTTLRNTEETDTPHEQTRPSLQKPKHSVIESGEMVIRKC